MSTPSFVVPLWDGPAPHSLGTEPDDIPSLTVFLPENATEPTPAVIICPGGGYGVLCFDYEGTNEAVYWQSRGVAGLVLKYRLPSKGYRHPVPLLDIQRALRLTRSRGGGWKVDTNKIGVMGFSAGGHLAATAATHFDAGNDLAEDPVNRLTCRPDFAILVYPVISMSDELGHIGSRNNLLGPDPDPMLKENLSNETQVTPLTPPTILVHTEEDAMVPIEHSRVMYTALQKAGVRSALHEYPHGPHGFGYYPDRDVTPSGWLEKVHGWLKGQGWVS